MGENGEAAIMEFYFTATINPTMQGNQVYEIALIKDGTPVTKAEYSMSMLDLTARNFAIFYKAEVAAGAVESYEIQASTVGPVSATDPILFDMANNNLNMQWGYRLYSSAYPLTDTIPNTC